MYKQIAKSKIAEGKNISVDGHESELYKIHEKMDKIATDQEIEYIAFHGNPVNKYYATNILFKKKSKSLEKLFKNYLKNKDSVEVLRGCLRGISHMDYEIYTRVTFEKQIINQADWEKKWKDSMIINKKENTPEYLNGVDILNTETKWTNKEIDSLVCKLDEIILDNQESSKKLIDLICAYHLYENVKVPYYEKIAYFEKRYNSQYIKKYLNFCRYGIREKAIDF
ncbi:hypothetical protein J3D55_002627 [Chryseobacterium ginsenosidimutans]|uniref:hypothetical protein n=1 Tax=Chryseobacterium ginsenosidimutans TaxID=687846 RepID=UPI002169A50D|nr:hypothetical protein [Chryseobacterium ginsenosidimutans]MCS3869711.1 hypothetical protein [Chryseobacterium ginsenosidimutans]